MEPTPGIRTAGDPGWLAELKSAHENLVAWMWALDELTTYDSPPQGRLETVRWFLSRARRDRRLVLEAIFETIPRLPSAQAEALRSVRALTYEAIARASEHIARWTLDAIEADWTRYREETRRMRDLWLRAIEQEQRTLYPLLERGLCFHPNLPSHPTAGEIPAP